MKKINLKAASAAGLCALGVATLGLLSSADAELPRDLLWEQGKPLVMQELEQGGRSGFDKRVVLYVSTKEEWDRAMKRLLREGALWCLPLPQAPDVDWSKKSILLVALGRRTHEDASVQINEIRLNGYQLLADVTVTVPTGLDSKHLYFPYHLVQIDHCEAEKAKINYSYDVHNEREDDRSASKDVASSRTADS